MVVTSPGEIPFNVCSEYSLMVDDIVISPYLTLAQFIALLAKKLCDREYI